MAPGEDHQQEADDQTLMVHHPGQKGWMPSEKGDHYPQYKKEWECLDYKLEDSDDNKRNVESERGCWALTRM
jgi:hypothetical protein